MGELTYDQLSRRLAQGKLGGSYFLTTEDPFLRDEAIALLAEAHLAGGLPDFDLDQISGDDAELLRQHDIAWHPRKDQMNCVKKVRNVNVDIKKTSLVSCMTKINVYYEWQTGIKGA